MSEITRRQRYRRTRKGLLCMIHQGQRVSSVRRGHAPVAYTLEQLRDRFLNDPLFISIYDRWVSLGYPSSEKPSLDRIDPAKPYTLDNLQVMTWRENEAKGKKEVACCRPVIQMDMEGNEIARFDSFLEAVTKVGVDRATLWRACRGRFKQAGGFRWRYAGPCRRVFRHA